MFRIVTLKKNKICNIIYSPTLVYPQIEGEVRIDRCTYKSDINYNLIFENDVIEDENKEKFTVMYESGRWILKSDKKSINGLENKKIILLKEKTNDNK